MSEQKQSPQGGATQAPQQRRKAPPSGGQRPRNAAQSQGAGANRPTLKNGGAPKNKPAPNENQGSLATVVVRNEFYKDRYRTLVKIAFLEAIAIVGLILSMVTLITVHQPQNVYFATTEDGRQVPMIPLSRPNLSKPALLSWATQAATEVMTFGFNDYRRRLQEASRHFTRLGWLSFTQALQRADLINAVRENRQAISAAPRSAPILLSEGVRNGRFQWEIRLPLNVTTSYGSGSKSDVWDVRLVIVRVPTLESPNGVGIEQWLAMGG